MYENYIFKNLKVIYRLKSYGLFVVYLAHYLLFFDIKFIPHLMVLAGLGIFGI